MFVKTIGQYRNVQPGSEKMLLKVISCDKSGRQCRENQTLAGFFLGNYLLLCLVLPDHRIVLVRGQI